MTTIDILLLGLPVAAAAAIAWFFRDGPFVSTPILRPPSAPVKTPAPADDPVCWFYATVLGQSGTVLAVQVPTVYYEQETDDVRRQICVINLHDNTGLNRRFVPGQQIKLRGSVSFAECAIQLLPSE